MTRCRFSTFSQKALSFLLALKRNNDREWFRARKDQYEPLLRAPMIGLIERLAGDFRNGDTPLGQKIFSVSKAQTEAMVEPDSVTDDLWRKPVSVVVGGLAGHPSTLPDAAST